MITAPPPTLGRASLLAGVAALTRLDRRLGALVQRHGPPPLWARPRGFPTLLRIILEQQVSLVSAAALYRRLAAALPHIAPEPILTLGVTGLQALGFTRQKASYVCGLAADVGGGALALRHLPRWPDREVSERLIRIRGIGPWTASIYLLMALRRPDVWPPGDLALHQALARLEGTPGLPSSSQAERLAERWRPLRAVAARILWHAYLCDRSPRARVRRARESAVVQTMG